MVVRRRAVLGSSARGHSQRARWRKSGARTLLCLSTPTLTSQFPTGGVTMRGFSLFLHWGQRIYLLSLPPM